MAPCDCKSYSGDELRVVLIVDNKHEFELFKGCNFDEKIFKEKFEDEDRALREPRGEYP